MWAVARYLEHFPELNICADLSHFTTVSEGNMEGDGYRELMDLAISRTHHIHARVGYLNGPQVPDPRVGMGREGTERFEGWWDRIIENALKQKLPFIAVNAEFGLPEYQPFHPETGEPLADIWDVCLYISKRFQERFSNHPEINVSGKLIQ
jgi:hypothetical protein|tara:strand:+ start:36 stop:488 length:453 start_codon:yes stop_codon:yes gene_type:complete